MSLHLQRLNAHQLSRKAIQIATFFAEPGEPFLALISQRNVGIVLQTNVVDAVIITRLKVVRQSFTKVK